MSEVTSDITEKFWALIEKKMVCVVPKYVQNILRVRGFECASSVKTLTNDDFNKLQEFVRSKKIEKFIPKESNKESNREILQEYYHIFWNEPELFEILPGHLRLLKEVVQYIKEMSELHGPVFFDHNVKIPKSDVTQGVRPQNLHIFRPPKSSKLTTTSAEQQTFQNETTLPPDQTVNQSSISVSEYYLSKERNHLFDMFKSSMQKHAHGVFEQISNYRDLINVEVKKDHSTGEMLYVAIMNCPWCGTGFEVIKNLLSNDNDNCKDTSEHLAEDIFNHKLSTNTWTHSSFVYHVKRCYHSVDHDSDHEDTSELFLLNSLVKAAKQNFGRQKQGYRHDDTIKMFAGYMKMLGGSLQYETMHANLRHSIPSPSIVDKFLSEKGMNVKEGVLRTDELKEFLVNRKLPLQVWISEDATGMIPKIDYDFNTNQLVGFTLPLNNYGMPTLNTYMARSTSEIEGHILNDNNSVSSLAYAIMANALSDAAPACCLTLFGTDNKFTFRNVLKRWSFIKKECRKRGISVYGNSSDGDSKCLKAMKIASRLGQKSEDFDCEWFCSGKMSSFQCNTESESGSDSIYTSIYTQDTKHIATKSRNTILKPSKVYPIGNAVVSNGHLKYLIQNVQKDKHLLYYTDIQPRDRQNFQSAEKVCSLNTQTCLQKFVPGSEGTVMYLRIMHYATTSFLDPQMNVVERIRRIWYAVFALRIWRSWLIQTKGTTLKANFISTNLYTCIELNAHSLIKFITKLREKKETHLFLPLLLSSQPCESFFRQLRSMSSTFSTVVVLSLLDILFRIKRLQLQSDIVLACSGSLKFPRIENRQLRAIIPATLPTNEVIFKEIRNAREEAMKDMATLNIGIDTMNTECQIQSVFEDIGEDAEDDEEDSDDEECNEEIDQYEHLYDSDNDLSLNGDPEDLIENQHKLRSMTDYLSMKDYSNKYRKITEESRFVVVQNDTTNEQVIRKSGLCWLLRTNKTSSSSDRLQRVKEDEWNKTPNCYLRYFKKSSIADTNSFLENEVVHIGEWCLFSFRERCVIGLILSFSYLNQVTYRAQEFPYSSAQITAIRSKPVGVLCTLYDWTQDRKMKLTTAEFRNTFIPIESYKATIAAPYFSSDDLLLHEFVLAKVNNFRDNFRYFSKNTNKTQDVNPIENQKESCMENLINLGDFVVVALLTKKSIEKYFVAEIIDTENNGNFQVKFLKRYLSFFIYPAIDDISLIEKQNIRQILEPPVLNRRNQLTFKDFNFKIE